MATNATVNIKIGTTDAVNSVDNLNNEINNTSKSVSNLKTELRTITEELQGLEPGSQRFQELSQRAAELRDTIDDTNTTIRSLTGNFTERLAGGITSTIGIGVAGFQALTSAQALFGTENEELQKTMVKLTALMNLSQAIQTFSGLDQKIVEIRATFNSLTTSVQAMRVAQTGANVATNLGTIATTALGLAMKSLPIIGLVATLGSLVYGLYQLISANDDASESTKQLKEEQEKQREEARKAAEESRKQRAEETQDFNILIKRLQATNQGSEQRIRLMTKLNTDYKLTLKNLKDEVEFQRQLENILVLVNKQADIKIRRQIEEKKLTELISAQELAQEKLNKATTLYSGSLVNIAKYTLVPYQDALNKANAAVSLQEKTIIGLDNQYENIESSLNKFIDSQNKSTESTSKATDKLLSYEEVLKLISVTTKSAQDSEEELFKFRVETGELTIDLVERERDKRIQLVTEQYNSTKKAIEDNIKDEQRRANALKLLETSYNAFILYETELREKRRLELEKQRFEQLEKEQKELNDFLMNQYFESFRIQDEFEIESRRRLLESINYEMSLRTTGYLRFRELIKQRYDDTLDLLKKEKETNEYNLELQLQNEIKTLKERLEANSKYIASVSKNEEGQYEFKLKFSKKYEDELFQIQKNNSEEGIRVFTQANITKERDQSNSNDNLEQLLILHTERLKNIEGEYNDNRKKAFIETNAEIFDRTLETIDFWSSYAQDVFNQTASIISEFQQREMDDLRQFLADSIALDREAIDAQFAQNLISKQQYDNEVEQLDFKRRQKELQLARKAFNQKKQLDIAAATMDGARAALSAFANTPGEIIIKSIAAGVAAAFAAVQISLIASQQFRAAKGGIVPGERSDYDKIDSKLSPGEAVINSKSTMDFLPILSMINEYAGGKSFMPDVPAVNQGQSFSPVFNGNGGGNMLVRAYVVESDITDSQRRINRIEKSITF